MFVWKLNDVVNSNSKINTKCRKYFFLEKIFRKTFHPLASDIITFLHLSSTTFFSSCSASISINARSRSQVIIRSTMRFPQVQGIFNNSATMYVNINAFINYSPRRANLLNFSTFLLSMLNQMRNRLSRCIHCLIFIKNSW